MFGTTQTTIIGQTLTQRGSKEPSPFSTHLHIVLQVCCKAHGPHKFTNQQKKKTLFSTIKTNRRTHSQIYVRILVQNSTCFGQFLCPPSGDIHCAFGTGTCYAGLATLTETCRVLYQNTHVNLEISASVGFYCKEICYDAARSYERKKSKTLFVGIKTPLYRAETCSRLIKDG
jgi:hypothetical protein